MQYKAQIACRKTSRIFITKENIVIKSHRGEILSFCINASLYLAIDFLGETLLTNRVENVFWQKSHSVSDHSVIVAGFAPTKNQIVYVVFPPPPGFFPKRIHAFCTYSILGPEKKRKTDRARPFFSSRQAYVIIIYKSPERHLV